MNNIINLVSHLTNKKSDLSGAWIKKNSNYEEDLCKNIVFNFNTNRYWDGIYKNFYIEIKKGKSIWLDEVRYSEILLNVNKDCEINTYTMFLIPSKNKESIDDIYLVDTKKIIKFLNINENWAKILLERNNSLKTNINCQQRLTLGNLKTLADYKI